MDEPPSVEELLGDVVGPSTAVQHGLDFLVKEWVHPEFVHGIARLRRRPGLIEIFVQCKIARGWHGVILSEAAHWIARAGWDSGSDQAQRPTSWTISRFEGDEALELAPLRTVFCLLVPAVLPCLGSGLPEPTLGCTGRGLEPPRHVVAEIRAGLVQTGGAVETVFKTEPHADSCESCLILKPIDYKESCYACGSTERVAARSLQGCFFCSRSFGLARKGARIGVLSILAAASVLASCFGGSALQGSPVQDLSVVTFLSTFTARDQ